MKFQGILDDIDTREKVAYSFYTDMEELDFQILLTDDYYVDPSSIHICFPVKIKIYTSNSSGIDNDMIRVNSFFAHFIKEISVTKYGSDKELTPTFSPNEIYQYPDSMLKHLPKDSLKTIEKILLCSKQSVYFNSTSIDRRIWFRDHRPNCNSNNHCKSKQCKRFKYSR